MRGRPVNPGARKRAQTMAALYRAGHTCLEIGRRFGVSPQAVNQFLRRHEGITAADGGRAIRYARKKAQALAKREARYLETYGCTFAEYQKIPPLARKRYREQKRNAHVREIEWAIKLHEWWTVWQQSGRWDSRGRGQGYVMCRRGDAGPYSVTNVFIASGRRNSSERGGRRRDLPIGVVQTQAGTYLAQRMIAGKNHYLGTFPTPALAHAAYLRADPQNKQSSRAA